MRIVTGTEGNWRILRILDAEPSQQTALEQHGFGADLVRRFAPGTRHFDPAVANLRQDLDELVRQSNTAGTTPGWAAPLEDLLYRAGQAQVPVAPDRGAPWAAGPSGRSRRAPPEPGTADIAAAITLDGA